jgi:alpha-amylase
MGFDAIWISPVVDNYDGGYHGYWARDMTKLNTHFGSEQDFIALITACHEKGIWVMVDVVANHMGNTNQNYSANVPFSSADHYHDYCIISGTDFQNKNQTRI